MPALRQIARDYAVPVATNVLGGLINRRAAGSATNRLRTGANTAMDTIRTGTDRARTEITTGADRARTTLADVFKGQQELLTPFREAGAPALESIRTGTGEGGDFNRAFTMADYELYKDPGFELRLQRGQKALEAAGNAMGNRFSGATLKRLSDYNQESQALETQAAFNRRESSVGNRFNRLLDASGIGERAANREVDAGASYGTNLADLETGTGANLANLETGTAQALADLQTGLASAEASGDVAKASTITDTISGILGSVEDVATRKALEKLFPSVAGKVAGAAGGAVSAGLAGGGAAAAEMGASLGAAASGAGGVGGTFGAGGAGVAGGGGGVGGAVAGFLTNPITIGIGAAIGIGLLWKASQKHQTANEWVQGTQNIFDRQMAEIDQRAQRGEISPQDQAELRRAGITDYLAAAMEFAKKGDKQRVVINQALNTLRQWYNPSQYGIAV